MMGHILSLIMKMEKDQARKAIFQAMLEADGNRAKAAKSLKVSIRTFYRYLDEYDMHGILNRCGWINNGGPPRKSKKGDVLRDVVFLRVRAGEDIDQLVKVVGPDNNASRARLMTILEGLRTDKKIKIDESSGRFVVA